MEQKNWKKLAIEEFGISEQLFDKEKFLTEKERYYHLKSHFSLVDYAELGLPQYASPFKQMKFAIENLDFEAFQTLWVKFPSVAPLLNQRSMADFALLNPSGELPPALKLACHALKNENLAVYRFLECSEHALLHHYKSSPDGLAENEEPDIRGKCFAIWKQVQLGEIEQIEEMFSVEGRAFQFFQSSKDKKHLNEFARICVDLVSSRFPRKVGLGLKLFENSNLFHDYTVSGVILAHILRSPLPNKFTSDLIEQIPNNIYRKRISEYFHRESIRNTQEDLNDDEDWSDLPVEAYLSHALLSGRRDLILALVREGLQFNSANIWWQFLLSNHNLLKKIELVEEFLPQPSTKLYQYTGFGRYCETSLSQEISDFGASAVSTGNLDLMRIAIERLGFELYDPVSFFIDGVLLEGHYLEARALYLSTDNKECQKYSRTLLLSREYPYVPKNLFE